MVSPQPSHSPISLVSHLSHELRTPLNAILGYSALVREELEEAGQYGLARDVDRIHRSADQLTVLFDKILDLAELESGEARLSNDLIDLVEVVVQVMDGARPLAARNGSELDLLESPHTLPMVGDVRRVKRVLTEIIENACRYTRDGHIGVRLSRQDHSPVDRMIVQVIDTGIGVLETEQLRLFDAFYRSDDAHSNQGLGLGLSISQSLCQLMGGAIRLHSQHGQGSTFTIDLPAEPD